MYFIVGKIFFYELTEKSLQPHYVKNFKYIKFILS